MPNNLKVAMPRSRSRADRSPGSPVFVWLLAVTGGVGSSRLRSSWVDPATAAGTPVMSTRSCGDFEDSWAVNVGRDGTNTQELHQVCAASRLNGNCYSNDDVPAVNQHSPRLCQRSALSPRIE